MTISGRKIISAILNQKIVSDVRATNGDTYKFYVENNNNIFATTTKYNNTDVGGTSIILSRDEAGNESAYIPTNIIDLNPTSVTTSTSSDGKLILTYVFTNTTGTTLSIKSIGLATRTSKPSYGTNLSVLILWDNVPERTVNAGDVFTFSVTINPQ